MRSPILFLGYDGTELTAPLTARGIPVHCTSDKVSDLSAYGLAVSYGYRHIIPAGVLATAPRPPLNLHVSYLPYNRGAHPNFWSFVDNTPPGVTIHEIDGGLDTGPIVCQRLVNFAEDETTFATTYARLRREIEALFIERLDILLERRYVARPQRGKGTYHAVRDLPALMHQRGWDCDIAETLDLLDRAAAAKDSP